jgi:hypothetical protein
VCGSGEAAQQQPAACRDAMCDARSGPRIAALTHGTHLAYTMILAADAGGETEVCVGMGMQ